jgi:hypothetical protein
MYILVNKKDQAFNGNEFLLDYDRAITYETIDQVKEVVKTLPKQFGALYAVILNSGRRIKVR